jgi:hypothetical protein
MTNNQTTIKPGGEENSFKPEQNMHQKGDSMKRLLILTLVMTITLFIGQMSFSQIADGDYDYDGTTDLETEAGTTLIHDLDIIKERAIDNIIRRVRRGDPNVLKFVVYDVLAEVHRKTVRTVDESIDPRTGKSTTDYYQVLGNQAALHSFIGGFDNQDPKVRLRCIGFLGDWVDDIGEQLQLIGKAANDRLNSAIETREEVKYGLELLQLKVLRKIDLNAIFNGDERKLAEISPDEFVVLVHGEPFIRQIFCVPPDVVLRSIRLNPWWIDEASGFVRMKDEAEEGEKANSRSLSDEAFPAYRMKLVKEVSIYRNYPEDAELQKRYGYKDRAGRLDIVSLYDWRYFRYQGVKGAGKHTNEERYVPAIFMGLNNDSLFVRENVARVLVRLTDGPLPYDPTNPAAAGASAVYDDPTVITEKPWEIKNAEGQIVGVEGILGQMSQNQRYRNIIKTAWQNVKFAQFIDVHQRRDPINQTRELNPTAGAVTIRDVDPNHGTSSIINPWGYTYCYRTDIADLMRRMGLGRMVDTCAVEEVRIQLESTGRRYFVEDLMDLDALSPNQPIPNWHGKDRIKDEVFEQ